MCSHDDDQTTACAEGTAPSATAKEGIRLSSSGNLRQSVLASAEQGTPAEPGTLAPVETSVGQAAASHQGRWQLQQTLQQQMSADCHTGSFTGPCRGRISRSAHGAGASSAGSVNTATTHSDVQEHAFATAAVVAQEQLQRMQDAWRESVEKDVDCLREVLAQYKERVERLEMQKKLLLSQVGTA